jgi:hypothetical protein
LSSESKKDIKGSAPLEIMSSAANFLCAPGARGRSAFSSPPHSIGFAVVVAYRAERAADPLHQKKKKRILAASGDEASPGNQRA